MPWISYVVYSPSARRSYVGVTTDAQRRLRQHRGELAGGARATRVASDWTYLAWVSGFADQRAALRFEWRLKRRRARGANARERRLTAIRTMLGEPSAWSDLRLLEFPTTAI